MYLKQAKNINIILELILAVITLNLAQSVLHFPLQINSSSSACFGSTGQLVWCLGLHVLFLMGFDNAEFRFYFFNIIMDTFKQELIIEN